MDILSLKKRKKELKLTLDEISIRSGIPKRTIEDIFRGATKNPRIDTMQAIEEALELDRSELRFTAEDRATGIEPTPTAILTADELELLEAYRAVKDEQGEKTAHAIKTLVQNLADGK